MPTDDPAPAAPERTAVRDEDAVDVGAVATWLRAQGPTGAGTLEGVPEVEQFRRGASNLTYLLRFPDRELILRRPPGGAKARGAHDMVREHTVQQRLAPAYPHVPAMVALCEDESVIGSPFYVMERVEGTVLRTDLPPDWPLDADGNAALASAFVDRLVELHAVDTAAVGLDSLGRGAGYVGRQVAGWTARWQAAVTPGAPDLSALTDWLDRAQPADVATCVIHNDYRLDNVVLDAHDPLRIRAVLDWEMATLGDPLMDLGGALTYWVQADDPPGLQAMRRQPTHAPGMPTREQVVQTYCERAGRSVDDWRFYDVFGSFRLAVIMQQIYYRYHLGQTTNPDYATYDDVVAYLAERCRSLVG